MSTELKELKQGQEYIADSYDYVITDDHTYTDIIKFIMEEGCDEREIKRIIKMLKDQRNE